MLTSLLGTGIFRTTSARTTLIARSSTRLFSSSYIMASVASSSSADPSAAAPGTTGTTQRTYADAIDALNTLQSNAAAIEAIRKSGGRLNDFALPEMVEYLNRIGYSADDLNALNVIHITGTKGKGSTSAFTSSLLQHANPNAQVGLYTSPHMVAVRERIRINGRPLEEDVFAKHFWEVWDRLGENTTRKHDFTPLRPIYFRFLTLVAYHAFLSLRVDAAILEVGIGGMYDSTNIVPRPVVCGITALGLDHTAMLGHTIELIAAQKAGIYKRGVDALAVRQAGREGAERVLEEAARRVGARSFAFVRAPAEAAAAEDDPIARLALGLPGAHQVSNASLALALAQTFVRSDVGRARFPGAVEALAAPETQVGREGEAQVVSALARRALEGAHWPGRCQRVPTDARGEGPVFYLDGAHTTDSLALAARWFVGASGRGAADAADEGGNRGRRRRRRVFIFNCTNGRSGPALLGAVLDEIERALASSSSSVGEEGSSSSSSSSTKYPLARAYFSDVAFCTNVTFRDGRSAGDLTSKAVDPADIEALTVQRELSEAWAGLVGGGSTEEAAAAVGAGAGGSARVHVLPSIEDALLLAKAEPASEVLVSGSLHLVGGVMAHLREEGGLDEELKSVYA